VEVVAKVIAARRVLARQRQASAAAVEWEALATRDELTGVATRRSLIADAERCLAEGRQIGIAILDLDDFKPINDNFGHLTGDRILRDVGALFQRRTRAHDFIARWGGDEFVLLVRDLSLEDVSGAADRLMTEIASMQWTSGDVFFAIGVTSGIAHSSLIENATLEQLLDVADRDLYAKKWVKKHPGERPDLYEYPAGRAASILSLPSSPENTPRRRTADEEK
jgi:diguanylate cyclase (GGDEF)-like protein